MYTSEENQNQKGNKIKSLNFADFGKKKGGKSILQVPDTGTRVLDNTRPFLSSSIVSF